MDIPFVKGIDPDSNPLTRAVELSQKRKKDAADLLLGQQKQQLEQDRLALDQQRTAAETRRYDAISAHEQNADRSRAASTILPLLDPNSPDFNPEAAHQMAQVHGFTLSRSFAGNSETAPQEPAAPQQPMEGPVPSPEDAMRGALSGTRTDNPNHAGQVFVDQMENNSAHLMGPTGGDEFNMSPTGLPRMPQESQWIPDPRRPLAADPAAQRGAQEAAQQEMERQQYAQQLAEAPARQAKYHQDLADFQQRKQFPAFQLDMGNGQPMTIDTMAMHRQAEGARQTRVEAYKQAYGDNPLALKVALPMAALGVGDKDIQAALVKHGALEEKAREADMSNDTRRYGIDARKRTGRGGGALAPGGKAWTKEESELANELKTYEQRSGLTGPKSIAEGQRELESALREAEANPNGTTQLRIMDKMIRSATGLGVRNQTLKTYQEHMGGIAARGEGAVEQWANGKVGKEQWRNVVESIRSQLAELQGQGGKANEDYHKMVEADPSFARHKDLIRRREKEMFGGLHGFGASNPLTDAARKNDRNQKMQAMPPADKAAVDWADKHPDDPRAGQILKLHGL